jgi:hypothetical protein
MKFLNSSCLMICTFVLCAVYQANAANMKYVEKSYLRRSTYLPQSVRRYYPEQLVDLLNGTHLKELKNISASRQQNFDELKEVLESETNATENANAASVERINSFGDKMDKAFTKFVKKAEKQALKLKKSAKWAAMKMHRNYKNILSFHKKKPNTTNVTVVENVKVVKKSIKEMPKLKTFKGSIYDQIASEADNDRDEMFANLTKLVSATNLEHNANETYAKHRYVRMIKKLTRNIAKLKPLFVNSNKNSGKMESHEEEDVLAGEKAFANETSMNTILDKTVKKMESSHDLLNELKEVVKEDQKKGN